MGKSLAELNVVISGKIKGFQDSIKKVERSLDKFQRNVERTGRSMTTNFTLPVLALGAAAIKSFADLDSLERGLVAVMGSSEAAAIELKKLQKASELPGLGFEEAVRGSVQLQAIGLHADEARKTLMGFGAAIAATGGGAEQLGAVQKQLTQMISKNRILQQDFGIIQENVPLVGKALQKAFGGKTIDQIRKTGISAKEFNAKLVEALQSLPEVQRATGGMGNAIENLGIAAKIGLASLGRMIDETFDLQGILESIKKAINDVVVWFESLDKEVRKNVLTFIAIVAAIGPALLIIGKLTGAASLAFTGIRTLAGGVKILMQALFWLISPIGLTVAAVAALGAAAIYVWKNWDAFSAKFQNMWVGIKNSVKGGVAFILTKIKDLQDRLGLNLFDFSGFAADKLMPEDLVDGPAFKSFGETVKEIGNDLMDWTGLGGKKKAPWLKDTEADDINLGGSGTSVTIPVAIDPKLAKKMQERMEEVRRMTEGMKPILVNPMGDIDLLDTSVSKIKEASEGIAKLKEELKGVQSVEAFDEITGQIKEYEEVISKLGPTTAEGVSEMRTEFNKVLEIGDVIKAGFTSAIEGVGSGIAGLLTGAMTIGDAAKAVVLPLIGILEQVGKMAIQVGISMFAIQKALTFLGPFGAIAAGVALIAVAKVAKAKISGSVPKMAKGGLLSGKTLFEGGEYPGAQNNPEVVAPLDKLSGMLQKIIEPMMKAPKMEMSGISPFMPRLSQLAISEQQAIRLEPTEMRIKDRTLVAVLEQADYYKNKLR